ncbi:succinate dehydrogenase assembly factor 4 [Hyphobacterium marinum]|uniref:Succinate dehydrogenase assembly factor 4 n=1 Tax=Hyphobacterium marinum TaxID=3116574 RepID=A0ABU7LUT7_9PROT|nr:succinate dehydrogenase assembly factor 4 [Hyphobacterium sp. Y6023]MEE2565318.1 succinate dehydrogenase assembly factor 4 [Hyphobacterium sp. Y6023]
MTETPKSDTDRSLSPAARRALAEADARRAAETEAAPTGETGGPSGPEPTRYGDWERKGIASDF